MLVGVHFSHQSPLCRGGQRKNAGALKPLVERTGEGEGGGTEQRREAPISINHFQDQFQPLGRVPGNRSQQCTLMRERKFHFIYYLHPVLLGSIWDINSPDTLKQVKGQEPQSGEVTESELGEKERERERGREKATFPVWDK